MFAEEDDGEDTLHIKFQRHTESNLNLNFLLEVSFLNVSSSFSLLSTPLRPEVNNRSTRQAGWASFGWTLANSKHESESELLNLQLDWFHTRITFESQRKRFYVRSRWRLLSRWVLQCILFFCLERADLFDEMFDVKIYCQDIAGVRKTHGTSPSWQWNNAVLFIFCFDTSLSVATHWVAYSSNCEPVFVCECDYFWHASFISCGLSRDLPTHTESTKVSCQRHPCIARCPLMCLVTSFLASLSLSCHKSDVWLPKH